MVHASMSEVRRCTSRGTVFFYYIIMSYWILYLTNKKTLAPGNIDCRLAAGFDPEKPTLGRSLSITSFLIRLLTQA